MVRQFAEKDARGSSPTYERLAWAVSHDEEVLALLDTLPPRQRQPNTLFAVVRLLNGPVQAPAAFREFVVARWPTVAAEMTVSRTDLAAWPRQLADRLESDGQIFYGAAGRLTVADQVRCELEIERESDSEISIEIEFSWTDPGAAAADDKKDEEDKDGEDEDGGDKDGEDDEGGAEHNGDEPSGQAEPTASPTDEPGDATAIGEAAGEAEKASDKEA